MWGNGRRENKKRDTEGRGESLYLKKLSRKTERNRRNTIYVILTTLNAQ